MIIVNVLNYDHVEQFISSFAMSKEAANNKLPDKSVKQATLWTVYPKIAKEFLCPRHLLIQMSHCLQGYLVIYLKRLT